MANENFPKMLKFKTKIVIFKERAPFGVLFGSVDFSGVFARVKSTKFKGKKQ